MTGVIILLGQLGIAAGGFVGMASIMNWYHKGGEKHGNHNNKINRPNNHQ